MIKIKFDSCIGWPHVDCLVCGKRDRLGDVVTEVYEDDKKIGYICDRCREAGSSTFKEKMMNRAKELKEYTAQMATWLEQEASQEWELPSQKEFKKAEWQAMANLMIHYKDNREEILNKYPIEEQKIILKLEREEKAKQNEAT